MYAASSVNEMGCFNTDIRKYAPAYSTPLTNTTVKDIYSDLTISFSDNTQKSGLSSVMFENLLMWSAQGPTLSVGDCNNDGYEDIWIGSSYDHIGF
jgi:hypothetical protein